MRQSKLLIQFSKLSISQKQRIEREIIDLVSMNLQLKDVTPITCPVCEKKARFIKKGKECDKQRFECCECHHRFVYDSKTITSCMKISEDDFIEICKDTIRLVPIKETAAKLNLSIPTVFNNRHKFLCLLEIYFDQDNNKEAGTVELDETYMLESTKGITPKNRKARHRGEPSKLRGISHEQVCIVTTTDRNGHEIFKAVGLGKPTSDSITKIFADRIKEKSVFYVDGTTVYDILASNTKCLIRHLKGHESYNMVEHINTVNSIHSMIKKNIAHYRGIATKYVNRYMALFVLMRKYMESFDNELPERILQDFRLYHFKIRRKDLKTQHLFVTYQ